MSDSMNPNRQPKGIPVGGQFAVNLHPEPGIGIGQTAGRPITTREEWNDIPVGKHVLVQYTGEEGSGPGRSSSSAMPRPFAGITARTVCPAVRNGILCGITSRQPHF